MAKSATYVPPPGQDGQLRIGTLTSFYRQEIERVLSQESANYTVFFGTQPQFLGVVNGSLSVIRAILAGCGVDVAKIEAQVMAEVAGKKSAVAPTG